MYTPNPPAVHGSPALPDLANQTLLPMFSRSWMMVAGWLIITPYGAQEAQTVYRFETADYRIEMSVEFIRKANTRW